MTRTLHSQKNRYRYAGKYLSKKRRRSMNDIHRQAPLLSRSSSSEECLKKNSIEYMLTFRGQKIQEDADGNNASVQIELHSGN